MFPYLPRFESGYSKATLYVYFKNKEQLVGVLVLESMQKLYDYINSALRQSNDTKERYKQICCALVKYQEEYPFYFKMVFFSWIAQYMFPYLPRFEEGQTTSPRRRI